jgi:hypothetical protein
MRIPRSEERAVARRGRLVFGPVIRSYVAANFNNGTGVATISDSHHSFLRKSEGEVSRSLSGKRAPRLLCMWQNGRATRLARNVFAVTSRFQLARFHDRSFLIRSAQIITGT